MTFPSACRGLIATCALAWVAPACAFEAGSPETMQKVRADVELYYQAHPTSRPSEGWNANHPPSTCAKPRFPRAMLRDELEGMTVLTYQVDALGKARNAAIARSSGWAVLDEVALEALSLCVLASSDASEWHKVGYQFTLQ
jgi:TonB family protein